MRRSSQWIASALALVATLVAVPSQALTLLDWDCTDFTTFNAKDFAAGPLSAGGLPAPTYYISTANPRPGAATPQHCRWQWDSPNSGIAHSTFENPSATFNHVFVTAYVSHSANFTPYTASTKWFIFKGDQDINATYLEAGMCCGTTAPGIVIQNMPNGPAGPDNLPQNIGATVSIQPGSGYHRIDWEVRLNDAGQSNAIARMYIDGVKKLEYLNFSPGPGRVWNLFDVAPLGSGSGTFPMFRDIDRIWVSTTAFDAGFGGTQLNAPASLLICRGAGCSPALVVPVGVFAALLVWARRRLRRSA